MKKTHLILVALVTLAGPALTDPTFAGGSNYNTVPGALPQVQGKVTEWPVPTPKFARDPAPAPDGNIYIAVMAGNRIARFDTKTKTFNEWDLPAGARPHGLLVDAEGIVWYTGNGNGTIGRLDPKTGKVTEHRAPSGGDPHTLVIDEKGIIWFTVQNGQRIGRLDRASGQITEYKTSGNPYGLAIDKGWRRVVLPPRRGKPRAASIRPPARSPILRRAAARARAASPRRPTACCG
ncbi:MAG: hypothetical protein IPG33_16280 [Betaproteobacteria bacterium]|nr:hypothetical protein [Betaproteobacteria bacterium]